MTDTAPSIRVAKNGPYGLLGDVPITRRRPVVGAKGHPYDWEDRENLPGKSDDDGTVWLCRCGHSDDKPFCDGSHRRVGFDGEENAPTTEHEERAKVREGSGLHMRDDAAICQHAGFCANETTNVWKMIDDCADPQVRDDLAAMIDHCPSGRLSRRAPGATSDDEPELPVAVGVVDDGPLSVTGGIDVSRSDGRYLQTRNRVVLCRCGASKIKPLCDGTHAKIGFADS